MRITATYSTNPGNLKSESKKISIKNGVMQRTNEPIKTKKVRKVLMADFEVKLPFVCFLDCAVFVVSGIDIIANDMICAWILLIWRDVMSQSLVFTKIMAIIGSK